jgi:hypothetical protein
MDGVWFFLMMVACFLVFQCDGVMGSMDDTPDARYPITIDSAVRVA